MGRFFKNGSFEQAVVQSYYSGGIAVLAITDRTQVEAGGCRRTTERCA